MSIRGAKRGAGRLWEIVRILRKYCGFSVPDPVQLRKMLEELGPTFVKIGQILSSRPDILPAAYCDELAKLREESEPMTISQARSVIEEEFGVPAQEIFLSFDEKPLGSASIAQVHAAVLRPEKGGGSGQPVAVKIQRPGIYDIMSRDVDLLRRAAKIAKPIPIGKVMDFNMIIDEIWAVTQEEMDFTVEARNAERFEKNCRDIAWAGCPRIERSLSTSRVLVMERVKGIPVNDIEALDAAGYDRNEIGEKLADQYVRQVLDDGFFHADPHSGNLLISGGKIVWLDFGMMGRLSENDRSLMKDAVRSVAFHDVDGLVSAILAIGDVRAEVDHASLYRDTEAFLDKYGDMELGDMNLADVFGDMTDLAMSHSIALPRGVSLLGRGIITLEGVLARLSPDISFLRVVVNRLYSENLFSDGLFGPKGKELRENLRVLYDAAKSVALLPSQLSELLGKMERGQFKTVREITESAEKRRAGARRVRILSFSLLSAGLLVAAGLFSGLNVPAVAGLPWPSFVCGLLGLCACAAAVIAALRKM